MEKGERNHQKKGVAAILKGLKISMNCKNHDMNNYYDGTTQRKRLKTETKPDWTSSIDPRHHSQPVPPQQTGQDLDCWGR